MPATRRFPDALPANLGDGTRDFVTNAIRNKLARRQAVLRITMRKLNKFTNLSDAEFADMLAEHEQESQTKGRRYERRRNVRFHQFPILRWPQFTRE